MSKALDIRKEAKTRIVAAGFATTVIRGKRDFNANELPGVCVYISGRNKRAESGDRYAMDAELNIEYHKSISVTTGSGETIADAIDDQADAMQVEVRAAMDIEPRQFGTTPQSAILTRPGLAFESDEIVYPESSGDIIAVRVVYSVPHIDDHG